tara:strand:+ start:22104 stop:22310 length:207 start_codon:yes stop_codon:yes gene_type:complete
MIKWKKTYPNVDVLTDEKLDIKIQISYHNVHGQPTKLDKTSRDAIKRAVRQVLVLKSISDKKKEKANE